MVRTQIQLTEDQYKNLKKMAARERISVAEVIRRSVDITLLSEILPDRDKIKEEARATFGAYADKKSDVSTNHDSYIAEAYES